MPVTKSRTGFYDIGLDQANTTRFLFGDDDSGAESKLYAQANPDDNFPTLVRREEYPNMVSYLLFASAFLKWQELFSMFASILRLRSWLALQMQLINEWLLLAVISSSQDNAKFFSFLSLTLAFPALLPFVSCLGHIRKRYL